jgi:hypothetical protein
MAIGLNQRRRKVYFSFLHGIYASRVRAKGVYMAGSKTDLVVDLVSPGKASS